MHHNLINQNPMINNFNTYSRQNPNFIPFQNNHLINNNVHVMNNLNNLLQQHKNVQNNINNYSTQQPINTSNNNNNNTKKNTSKSKKLNIIEEMLKPQVIIKDNKDVESNFKVRNQIREKILNKNEFDVKPTNMPYKTIIKDRIINKKVEDVKLEDLLVHKSVKGVDDDKEKFEKELKIKENEKDKINDELQIEFNVDNYDKHKKSFEYNATFIRNLAYEQNVFDENKQDCIEFYQKKQKEAEEGKQLCDQILRNIIDEGIISKDELPTENTEDIS
ncbi:low complexity protein [Moumouvirus australiensis]|uniref:Low complexity protein n=1 Tax=Moumouvirus australiensis TaxID=2109587 RepID=A0A2P1ELD7_9VIRU|nr:low complexity protein [Moumouvirus australiensis]AVL94687.1 low complexity protein [Moumouvirus australiensis]